jgi:hypothetical protein
VESDTHLTDGSEDSVHSLGTVAAIDNALVTICPRVGIGTQFGQEGAGHWALLGIGTSVFSPSELSSATMLFHTSELAVRLASDNFTLLPEVGLRTVLLEVTESRIGAAEGTGVQSFVSKGTVEDGYVHVGAISIDYRFVSWEAMTGGSGTSTITQIGVKLRLISCGTRLVLILPLKESMLWVASTSTLGAGFIAAEHCLDATIVQFIARSVEEVAAETD